MRFTALLLGVSLAALAAGAQATASEGPAAACASHTNAKRFDEAKAACDQAVAQAPGSADALLARAQMYFGQQKYDLAIADLDAALEANPRFDSALFLRGVARQRTKEHQAALVDFETALLVAPKNVEYLIATGDLTRALGQHDKAVGYFDRAIAVNPASVPALMGRGHALRGKRDYQAALKSFDAAVRAAPQETQPLHWRGHTYSALQNYAKAEADYAAALAISPRSADILSDRGDALTQLGREADALASYSKAVETDPSYVRGVRSRAVARFKAGDYLGARVDIEMAHRQQPMASTEAELKVIDAALTRLYQGPLETARAALRDADPGGVSCDSELVSAWDYADALRDAGGDLAAAEAAATRKSLADYRACLGEERTAGAGATEQLPALRLKIAELLAGQTKQTAALEARCAQVPEAKATCDGLRRGIAEGASKLKSDQKLIEAAALAKGGSVAQMEAAAPQRVAASVAAARAEFAAKASSSYADAFDRAGLEQHVRLVRSGSVRTIYSTCGSIHLSAPRSDSELSAVNQQLSNHRDCLSTLGRQSSTASYEFTDAYMDLAEAIETNAMYKGFRCSVRPGASCVDDAAWTRIANLATPALRDQAQAYAKAAGQVPDQVDAELTRINDAVDRINAETKRHNTWVGVNDALNAFANAFNAATPSYGYGGGYSSGGGYYPYNSSTSAPGVK